MIKILNQINASLKQNRIIESIHIKISANQKTIELKIHNNEEQNQ